MKKPTPRQTKFWAVLASIFMLALACLMLSLNSGCSGYRSAVKTALYSNYQPTINLTLQPATTNHPARISIHPRNQPQALTSDARISAPFILCAEQINLTIFGGAAASNSVLSDITAPLTGAP